VSTNWLASNGADSCYPASMVILIWFADENVHHISTKQHN